MVWKKMLFDEFQLHFALKTPIILCSRENMGWKFLFEEFQDGCLVHDHL